MPGALSAPHARGPLIPGLEPLAFSPDGRLVASESRDLSACLYHFYILCGDRPLRSSKVRIAVTSILTLAIIKTFERLHSGPDLAPPPGLS
jgi:hypothetical protein